MKPEKNALHRHQFLELLLRVAMMKHKRTPADSLAKLFCDPIFESQTYKGTVVGQEFRAKYCYNSKIDDFFWNNLAEIEKIYTKPGTPFKTSNKKRFMKLKEVKAYVHKMGVKLSRGKVAECFYKSLVTDIDPVRNNRMKVMYP
jgi:hypothetical protein